VRLTQSVLAKALGGEEPLAPATVASWENRTNPKLPPRDRMRAYARFFATRRSVEGEPRLLPIDSLTEEERDEYEALEAHLLDLHGAARPSGESAPHRRSWHFTDIGPMTLVCAQLPKRDASGLADPADPNYAQLLSFADADALVELHGHIRAENPTMEVFYKAANKVVADDLSGHIVLLGGIAWNEITRRLSQMTNIPVRQVEDPSLKSGEIFVIEENGSERKFFSKWLDSDKTNLAEDVGLLARLPNPLNSGRTLTICNGIHSRGVLGAVRALTDARLRESNERYISRRLSDAQSFGLLVRVPVIEGHAMTPDFNVPGTVLYQWPLDSEK
jgi:hypothetical protein